jgi:DNA polymerase sigma
VEKRKGIISDIEEYIVQFYPTAKLELFGSSCNGFGLLKSDVDICLTFTDSETGKVVFITFSMCDCVIMCIPYLPNYKMNLSSGGLQGDPE